MWCQKFNSVLAIRICLERQDLAKDHKVNQKDLGKNNSPYWLCEKCDQGKKAAFGELNDKDVDAILETINVREAKKMEEQKAKVIQPDSTDKLPPGVKKCLRCGVPKDLDQFSPAKKSKDGHRGDCKACNATYARERLNKRKGPDRVASAGKLIKEKPTPTAPDSPNNTITLRFTPYPDLYRDIIAQAQDELRTPENLILYCVAKYFRERAAA
jgi:hypothetical protein